jgi:hypothetical protein
MNVSERNAYARAHSDRTALGDALLRVESAAKAVAADVRVPQRCVDDLIAALAGLDALREKISTERGWGKWSGTDA